MQESHRKLALQLTTVALISLVMLAVSIECHIKRTQYHEQGLDGPKSYKFGYTSGDYKNPQERHEVSDGYGHVKGWYSFVDAEGKHQVVHYEAHPKHGFKVFNHNKNQKAYNNGKRHYGS